MVFLNYLINGISLGSIYAIIALGYTMVYGIAKMLNFAHGDVIMVGAYICFFSMNGLSSLFAPGSLAALVVPALAGTVLAMVVCTVLGITIERLAYKPLRQATSLAVLITAIGVSYFLQNAAQLLWSSSPKVFTPVVSPSAKLTLFDGQLSISWLTIVTVLVCVAIMLALTAFTGRTKMGKAMRACSEDKAAAQLMGIDVNRTISMTFAIGSALAAIAGVLFLSTYTSLTPTTGSMPGIKAFTAAVFGGIGSIPGALLGGLLLGVIETFARAYISTELSTAIVFGVLIIVLLVKPAGLIGPNGAGKTTVFNLLTKVYQPTRGTVLLDGVDTHNMNTVQVNKAGIARTFQNIRLFNNLSVEDNVKIGMHNSIHCGLFSGILRLPRYWKEEKTAHERALELLSIFHMQDLAGAKAGSLPYGAQRRLEIIRALGTNPSLLLLDEPAAGMNPSETAELMENIVKIRDTFQIAILLIEHDMNLVMGICEGICVLNFGQIIAKGTPTEIQNNPEVIKAYLGGGKEG